ncbi:MAG: hypothetical protein WBQ94_03545 [Terracidiphilus sp.]
MEEILEAPIEEVLEPESIEGESQESTEPEPVEHAEGEKDNPYTTRFSREMRAALKAWEAANPEAAKYAKQARDNHARLYALTQIEPNGIDGVREKYAAIEAAGGPERLVELQQAAAEVEEVDQAIAAGDVKALEAFGPEFDEGLAKLAPHLLDRIKASRPEEFGKAVLPHFVAELAKSDLVRDFNSVLDVLQIDPKIDPRWTSEQKLNYIENSFRRMSQWFAAQEQKAGQVKTAPATNQPEDRMSEVDRREQDFHWKTNIQPEAAQYENQAFDKLFAPYQARLKLDENAKDDLRAAFKAKLSAAGRSDTSYMQQIKIYRGQKNPEPSRVNSVIKAAIDRHSKSALEALVTARYSRFLNGKPKQAVVTNGSGKSRPPAAPGVEIRTVKPPMNEIDHKNTPIPWLAEKKYRLTNGKIIQVRPN